MRGDTVDDPVAEGATIGYWWTLPEMSLGLMVGPVAAVAEAGGPSLSVATARCHDIVR